MASNRPKWAKRVDCVDYKEKGLPFAHSEYYSSAEYTDTAGNGLLLYSYGIGSKIDYYVEYTSERPTVIKIGKERAGSPVLARVLDLIDEENSLEEIRDEVYTTLGITSSMPDLKPIDVLRSQLNNLREESAAQTVLIAELAGVIANQARVISSRDKTIKDLEQYVIADNPNHRTTSRVKMF